MPVGKSWRTSHFEAAGPGGGADQSQGRAVSWETAPVPSKRAWTDVEFQSRLAAPATSRNAASRRCGHNFRAVRVEVEPDAAGPDHAPAEAIATEEGGQVEEIAPESPAERGGRQEPHVTGQGPEVTGVVGQAFQLQGDAAEHLRPDRELAAGEAFDGLAVGDRMANRRVARTVSIGWSVRLSGPPTSARSAPRC